MCPTWVWEMTLRWFQSSEVGQSRLAARISPRHALCVSRRQRAARRRRSLCGARARCRGPPSSRSARSRSFRMRHASNGHKAQSGDVDNIVCVLGTRCLSAVSWGLASALVGDETVPAFRMRSQARATNRSQDPICSNNIQARRTRSL